VFAWTYGPPDFFLDWIRKPTANDVDIAIHDSNKPLLAQQGAWRDQDRASLNANYLIIN
jgi:hypothetical protein